MDLKKLSDEALVSYIQENDGKGYEEIIDRYQIPLVRYASRIIIDPDQAEDAIQDTLISAYENINSFDTKRKFSSWIYRIAHNKAINEIRKNKNKVNIEDVPEIRGEEDGKKIEEKIDKKYAYKILEENIKKLPLKYGEIISLRYLEEKSYEEISDILRIPTSTVGVRIKRGLEKLKDAINLNIEDYL